MKVLIVDDEKLSREGLKDLFDWNRLQMEVVYCASDGQEALEYISANPVDILITDVRMPRMDGLELLKRLSKESYNLSIIILSGYSDFSYAQKAIQYGVSDYLLKPIHFDELEKTLISIKEKRSEGVSRIHIDPEEKKRFNENAKKDVDNLIRQLIESVRVFSFEQASATANSLHKLIVENNYSVAIYKRQILRSIDKVVEDTESKLDYELAYFTDTERLMNITNVMTIGELKEQFLVFLNELCSYIKKLHDEENNSIPVKLKKMVDENFADKELSLNSLAAELYVTPNYLGSVFKNEFGTSFSEYLETLRLEKAKVLLLNTDLKVYEIAENCGYSDGQYFSRVFKSDMGMTPVEYKNKEKKKLQ